MNGADRIASGNVRSYSLFDTYFRLEPQVGSSLFHVALSIALIGLFVGVVDPQGAAQVVGSVIHRVGNIVVYVNKTGGRPAAAVEDVALVIFPGPQVGFHGIVNMDIISTLFAIFEKLWRGAIAHLHDYLINHAGPVSFMGLARPVDVAVP